MPLMNVWGTRSGDSLPSELRTGVKEWHGTNLMPSLRLSAGGSGLSGMSIHYGATEGPSGFRAYNWPPFGYRGMSGLGQGETCITDPITGDVNCFPSGADTTGAISCQPDDTAGLVMGQVYCSTNSVMTAWQEQQAINQSSGPGLTSPPQTTNVKLSTGQTVQTQHPVGWSGATVCAPGQACPQAPAGYQWVPMIGATGNMLAQVLAVSQGMGVSTNLATGQQVVYPQGTQSTLVSTTGAGAAGAAAGAAAANIWSSPTTLMILGVGVLAVVMMMQSGGRR